MKQGLIHVDHGRVRVCSGTDVGGHSGNLAGAAKPNIDKGDGWMDGPTDRPKSDLNRVAKRATEQLIFRTLPFAIFEALEL